MTVGDHFERVAAVYESLRTTDEAPVRRIRELLPDRPVVGLDIGCGTGRYSRPLGRLLPAGSRLVASDVSAAMLAEFTTGDNGRAHELLPLRSTAEELPLRTCSLDMVTAFNCVHHFDLGRFLTAVARVLRPDGQRPVLSWLHRARAAPAQRGSASRRRRADRRAHDGRDSDLHASALKHGRAAQGAGRGGPLLDVLAVHAGRKARFHRCLHGPPAPPRGCLG